MATPVKTPEATQLHKATRFHKINRPTIDIAGKACRFWIPRSGRELVIVVKDLPPEIRGHFIPWTGVNPQSVLRAIGYGKREAYQESQRLLEEAKAIPDDSRWVTVG